MTTVETAPAELMVQRVGSLGRIVLNRPKALNSLTLGMVRGIHEALNDFEQDSSVAAVLVTGEGGGQPEATLRLPELGRCSTSLEECLERDLTGSVRMLEHPYFYERIRAILIDKDLKSNNGRRPTSRR